MEPKPNRKTLVEPSIYINPYTGEAIAPVPDKELAPAEQADIADLLSGAAPNGAENAIPEE